MTVVALRCGTAYLLAVPEVRPKPASEGLALRSAAGPSRRRSAIRVPRRFPRPTSRPCHTPGCPRLARGCLTFAATEAGTSSTRGRKGVRTFFWVLPWPSERQTRRDGRGLVCGTACSEAVRNRQAALRPAKRPSPPSAGATGRSAWPTSRSCHRAILNPQSSDVEAEREKGLVVGRVARAGGCRPDAGHLVARFPIGRGTCVARARPVQRVRTGPNQPKDLHWPSQWRPRRGQWSERVQGARR